MIIADRPLTQNQIDFIDSLSQRGSRRNYNPGRDGNRLKIYGASNETTPSSATPSKGKTDIKPDNAKAGKNDNQTPSGKNPPNRSGASENLSPKNTDSQNSNTNTTLGLFVTTLLFGGASGLAHFTNLFGEGNTRNFIAFSSDCGGIFTGALALSSALAPVGKDDAGVHEGVINPSAN